jgi:microcystin-dependent protein
MGNPYIGEIRMFAGSFAPLDWNFCDGTVLAISQNPALFNLIGTTYGGDGVNTFALPDLRSRVPVHQGALAGGSNYVLGQMAGSERVTVTAAQMPSHTHVPRASSAASGPSAPTNNFWASSALTKQYASTMGGVMASGAMGATGGTSHDNMLPFQAINFIISLSGVYPSQT